MLLRGFCEIMKKDHLSLVTIVTYPQTIFLSEQKIFFISPLLFLFCLHLCPTPCLCLSFSLCSWCLGTRGVSGAGPAVGEREAIEIVQSEINLLPISSFPFYCLPSHCPLRGGRPKTQSRKYSGLGTALLFSSTFLRIMEKDSNV